MGERPEGLTIEDLAERVNVPVRTVRYYVTEGLLPGPGARGKAASYGEEHLLRLLLIRKLVERHVPLKEVGERLSGLSVADVRALLAQEVNREAQMRRAEAAPSPRAYVAALLDLARASPARQLPSAPAAVDQQPARAPHRAVAWRRWEVAPGVEVHVRSDVASRYGKRLEAAIARLNELLLGSSD